MIDVPVVSQRQVPKSPDRPQTVEIHVVQFVDTKVNTSVNMRRQVSTERKSVEVARTHTALNDEIVEVPGMCQLTIQTMSMHRSRWFIRHSSGGDKSPRSCSDRF